jgi:predicted ATPase/DNA-binding SARP family transcriptional activator
VLEVRVLGGLEIRAAGRALAAEVVAAKGLALLVYLALTGQAWGRSALAGLLWGDLTEEAARGNLRTTLSKLRRALPDGVLLAGRQQVALAEGRFTVDAARFEAGCRAGTVELLHEAASLYRGEFLAGFQLASAPEFEAWAGAQRARLHALALDALYRLAKMAGDGAEPAAGIPHARRLLALEPWHEEGHRLLMALLARSGQRSQALAQYETLRQVLEEELGVAPAAETEALVAAIRDGTLVPAAIPAPSPAPRPAAGPVPRHNLPASLTPFLGRDEELGRLLARLRDGGYRLVTVTGEGGVGKSRLALEAARALVGEFKDGVYLVPLAGLAVGAERAAVEDGIAGAVAAALGMSFATAEAPARQLLNALRGRECLLVLDNFEHVGAGAGLVLALLAGAPGVTVLATSRAPLHLQAEVVLRLAGLALPEGDGAGAGDADSVRLFAERAERAAGRVVVTDATLADVAAICRLVGGLPLAIELAAAGARYLPPYAIRDRLEASYAALATTMLDVPPRHRSLRAVFDTSWALLSAAEQAALARLSAFHGGFGLAAVEAVAGAEAPLVFALLDKSLVQPQGEAGGVPRFGLHGLLRQYAAERLAALGMDGVPLSDRHAGYYLARAGALAAEMQGTQPQGALRRLQVDGDNLAAAWEHAVARPLPEALAAGAAGMGAYWAYAGLFAAGEAALGAALDALGDGAVALRGRLAAARAALLFELNRLEEMEAAAAAAIEHGQAAGDGLLEAEGRLRLGQVLWRRGAYEAARDELEEAGRLAAGEERLEGTVLRSLAAVLWRQGDLAEARALCERSLARLQAAGDVRGEARSRHFLGILALNQHDVAAAQRYLEPVLRLAQETGERRVELSAYAELAQVAGKQGRTEAALALYAQEHALAVEMGVPWQVASNLSNTGDLRQRLGDFAGARACYEAALAQFREMRSAQGESNVLAFMGLLAWREGDFAAGEAACRAALARAEEGDARREQALAWSFLAHNLGGQGRWVEARDGYERARAAWAALGEEGRRLEAQAGLAQAALALGDAAEAAALVAEVAAGLDGPVAAGADVPEFVAAVCGEVRGE